MYSLDSIEKSTDDLVTLFELQLRQLIQHDFISQHQSKYFTKRKENLAPNEMLIISDFSENYTFIVKMPSNHSIGRRSNVQFTPSHYIGKMKMTTRFKC